jgi:hypothetical protein
LVSQKYQPGFCECGRTSTEVIWKEPTFCGYCGTEISIIVLPRRYRLGYLPLSIPISHFWYYHYEPRPLQRLTRFSRRIFLSILYCEIIVAEEAIFTLKIKNRTYFSSEFRPIERLTERTTNSPWNTAIPTDYISTNNENLEKKYNWKKSNTPNNLLKTRVVKNIINQCNIIFPETEVFSFPWYCFYRNTPFFLSSKRRKKRKFLSKCRRSRKLE